MKNIYLIFILALFVFGCKASKISSPELTHEYIYSYIDNLKAKSLIAENPLIVYNTKIIGNLEDVGISNLNLENMKRNNLHYLEKNSFFYEFLFGKDARKGILVFSNQLFLHCSGNVNHYMVLDGNRVELESIEKLDWNNLTNFFRLSDIKDKDGNFIELTIFTTK